MKRNSAIEIYRVLLMLGIVTLHQFSYVGMGHHWLPRMCTACVVGFCFISGFYGIKLSFSKFARLYGVALFCALWFCLAGGGAWTLIGHLRSYWFVNSYIMLMLCAPLINQGLESCSTKEQLLRVATPVLILVFVWEFLSIVPVIKDILPADRGFGTHNGLTLVGIYVAARLYRVLEVERLLPLWGWCLICVVSGMFCAINLGKYNSPFALCFAASCFTLFKKLGESSGYQRRQWVGSLFAYLAPSMLSVYLLHVGGVVVLPGFRLDTSEFWNELSLRGFGAYTTLAILIATTFVVCVIIDHVRRVGLLIVNSVLQARRRS